MADLYLGNTSIASSKLWVGNVSASAAYVGDTQVWALPTGVTPILDLYGSATAAYSMRKLNSAYTGSAIRVRRTSDNTEQDIGFLGDGSLDVSALTTFVGANTGYVSKIYDQSENGVQDRTLVNTTFSAGHPAIIISGTLQTVNGFPAIRYATQAAKLAGNFTAYTSTSATSLSVHSLDSSASGWRVFFNMGTSSPVNLFTILRRDTGLAAIYRGSAATAAANGSYTSGDEIQVATQASTPLTRLWRQGSEVSLTNAAGASTASTGTIMMGNDPYNSGLGTSGGYMLEAINWFSTFNDTDVDGVNANANAYYSFY